MTTPISPPAPEQQTTLRPLRQLALQAAALIAVLSLAWPYYGLRNEPLPWPHTALLIGAVAWLLARLSRQPWWWQAIHALFAPLAWAVSLLSIAPGWFLLSFTVLLLVYRGAASGQIPLYLSNLQTAEAIAELTRDRQNMRFIDLGAGIGSLLRPLAHRRPDAELTGIENAPATWLTGRLLTLHLPQCDWRWGDLWASDLSACDVVYVFLSPAPMPDLWKKAQREMRAGSLLISNSFAIPKVDADWVAEVDDGRQTRLYGYLIKA